MASRTASNPEKMLMKKKVTFALRFTALFSTRAKLAERDYDLRPVLGHCGQSVLIRRLMLV